MLSQILCHDYDVITVVLTIHCGTRLSGTTWFSVGVNVLLTVNPTPMKMQIIPTVM